jgi:hypothetical protein
MPRPAPNKAAIRAVIRRYLATGHDDPNDRSWLDGASFLEMEKNRDEVLVGALLVQIRARSVGMTPPALPTGMDTVAFARERVRPMVEGLFPEKEREQVLALLERSVVFLTQENIEEVIKKQSFLHSAWDIADLYLGSIGARRLRKKGGGLVGLSQETTCYLSLAYFSEDDRFADFVVHEAAHIFHNWKREYAGMPHTRNKEWLLQIEYRRREEFAYSCEFYSRILALGSCRTARVRLAEECIADLRLGDSADQTFVAETLREAAAARNGWKRILQRCAAAPPLRGAARRAWLASLTSSWPSRRQHGGGRPAPEVPVGVVDVVASELASVCRQPLGHRLGPERRRVRDE